MNVVWETDLPATGKVIVERARAGAVESARTAEVGAKTVAPVL